MFGNRIPVDHRRPVSRPARNESAASNEPKKKTSGASLVVESKAMSEAKTPVKADSGNGGKSPLGVFIGHPQRCGCCG
jgi:hypothetical protein